MLHPDSFERPVERKQNPLLDCYFILGQKSPHAKVISAAPGANAGEQAVLLFIQNSRKRLVRTEMSKPPENIFGCCTISSYVTCSICLS